jgi:hypothetical protein
MLCMVLSSAGAVPVLLLWVRDQQWVHTIVPSSGFWATFAGKSVIFGGSIVTGADVTQGCKNALFSQVRHLLFRGRWFYRWLNLFRQI